MKLITLVAIAVNSRHSVEARNAFKLLPPAHPARKAHAGLADPQGFAKARAKRRRQARLARRRQARG